MALFAAQVARDLLLGLGAVAGFVAILAAAAQARVGGECKARIYTYCRHPTCWLVFVNPESAYLKQWVAPS